MWWILVLFALSGQATVKLSRLKELEDLATQLGFPKPSLQILFHAAELEFQRGRPLLSQELSVYLLSQNVNQKVQLCSRLLNERMY